MNCNYHPYLGTDGEPIDPIGPDLIRREYVTFSCPDPLLSIDLRNPEFGDTKVYTYTRINRQTLNGQTELYGDPIWPKDVSFNLAFNFLSAEKAGELQDFLDQTAGLLLTFTDFLSLVWTGIILNPGADIAATGRYNFGTTLNFKGTLQ